MPVLLSGRLQQHHAVQTMLVKHLIMLLLPYLFVPAPAPWGISDECCTLIEL